MSALDQLLYPLFEGRRLPDGGNHMKSQLALGAVLSIAVTSPVLAQQYYVVQDSATKKCTVVHEKPTTTTMTVVGDGTVYKTETEAQSALKTTKVCTSN